ncbi:response regulator [Fibrella forsythiae]|uniref:Response regulator n=1 Tax=Fibrella forsythiae TaxID=2817061 RepID=A0ABS3JUU1_9BACT|nr:response regulator [Fibrella forsythiae]MBO0952964.1 response regulator [Fibrella forsythiae]
MKTILVIEDHPEMRANITEILQLAPYQVLQAANGKQGVDLARRQRPDLILCDVMMPDLDGYGVLHIVSKDAELSGVPFIFLTAKVETTDFRFGMNLGADDYLTKPFDDVSLLNAVELRLKKGKQGQSMNISTQAQIKLGLAVQQLADARDQLCENFPSQEHKKKQVLFRAGNSPSSLYFIRRGQLKLFSTDRLGNSYITGLYGAGDFVGYQPLLAATAYKESAEVLDQAEVCVIPKADFLYLIQHNRPVATEFSRMLAQDLANSHDRLLKLAYQSVRQRTVDALLLVQRKFYADRPPVLTLTRESWSQLVGASIETVIRTLRDLQKAGLIDLTGSQVTLLDIDRLSRLNH